jgi:hypothetical protein
MSVKLLWKWKLQNWKNEIRLKKMLRSMTRLKKKPGASPSGSPNQSPHSSPQHSPASSPRRGSIASSPRRGSVASSPRRGSVVRGGGVMVLGQIDWAFETFVFITTLVWGLFLNYVDRGLQASPEASPRKHK